MSDKEKRKIKTTVVLNSELKEAVCLVIDKWVEAQAKGLHKDKINALKITRNVIKHKVCLYLSVIEEYVIHIENKKK